MSIELRKWADLREWWEKKEIWWKNQLISNGTKPRGSTWPQLSPPCQTLTITFWEQPKRINPWSLEDAKMYFLESKMFLMKQDTFDLGQQLQKQTFKTLLRCLHTYRVSESFLFEWHRRKHKRKHGLQCELVQTPPAKLAYRSPYKSLQNDWNKNEIIINIQLLDIICGSRFLPHLDL